MPVKFKIGFQIDAETLFSIVAKFLPLDNLSVEEVIERPHPAPQPRIAGYPQPTKLAKPQKRRPGHRRTHTPPKLDKGVNKIILDALADGNTHPPSELKAAIKAGGYSPHSLGSRMGQLIRDGHVVQPDYGVYAKGKSP
jgi:hypothetical protein